MKTSTPDPKSHSEREDDDADGLTGSENAAEIMLGVITAKSFGEGAQDRVTNQINGEDLAIEFSFLVKQGEQRVKNQVQAAFVELNGVHADTVSPMFFWEMNGPGEVCGSAVATAGHEAADSAKGVAQGNAGRHDISEPPKGQFSAASVDNCREGSANQPAVIHKAGTHVENVNEGLAGEFLVPVRDDVEGARAEDCADDDPRSQIVDVFAFKTDARSTTAGCAKPKQKTGSGQDAVPIDLKAKNFECDVIHRRKEVKAGMEA